ncbi:CRISPR-associated endonuclease Cas2 [Sulfodiicoccus acidiphilus]|uniref:CRISPR-associated endoribonuclease Cas2 n=1 Tax=Sulfodiicoccus acidiphilus TaxID=1670455 RepID=A0A348B5A1_9CREN|nr:CRISPR-associated endonuclease Cas2 [Sulfodiicoccus acidiphilus]BBD73353.1 CRISPR-associated endonuclease Cas2 [Sulfodiicoccus acidiphilus]GGT88895.1 CRISPR-associated endonuclease Cas2 [Sulfodiicoccus acidiphilus]
MYVILVYDFDESRVNRALQTCRKYLTWVQRSVFEGEISEGKFYALKEELRRIMRGKDSVIIYLLETGRYLKREVLGEEGQPFNVL